MSHRYEELEAETSKIENNLRNELKKKEEHVENLNDINQYLLKRIENFEIIEAEMSERLKIACQIAKQILKEIRESDSLINQSFMKILDQGKKMHGKQKDISFQHSYREKAGRKTVCNVPQITPKLLIDKNALKVTAR